MDKVFIGVVGSVTRFNEEKARSYISEAFDQIVRKADRAQIVVVSRLSQGVSALAFEEASRRDWYMFGVTSPTVKASELRPHKIITGDNPEDETEKFLNLCTDFVRVGGGEDVLEEMQAAREMGKKVYEYNL